MDPTLGLYVPKLFFHLQEAALERYFQVSALTATWEKRHPSRRSITGELRRNPGGEELIPDH